MTSGFDYSEIVYFVDTETTGLDPDRHEVWEIGLISANGNEWAFRPRPLRLPDADPTALRLTRFYDRTRDWEWSLPADVAREVSYLLAGVHMVGAVPSFDATFLSAFLRRYGFREAWHYHLVDVEALAAGKLGVVPPWDSLELSRGVGVDPDQFERHTAIGDARWAKAVYEAVLRT